MFDTKLARAFIRVVAYIFLLQFMVSCTILITENSMFPRSNKSSFVQDKQLIIKLESDYPAYRARDISVRAYDGLILRGVYLENIETPSDTAIVFFGGSAATIKERINKRGDFLTLLNTNIVWFDYRGYGFSDNVPDGVSLEDFLKDTVTVYDFVKSELKLRKVIVHGISAGGVLAMYLSGERELDGLVIQSAANDLNKLVEDVIPKVVAPILKVKISNNLNEVVQANKSNLLPLKYSGPTYFITNKDDNQIPMWHVLDIYETSESKQKLVCITKDIKHGDELEDSKCIRMYQDFLKYIQ